MKAMVTIYLHSLSMCLHMTLITTDTLAFTNQSRLWTGGPVIESEPPVTKRAFIDGKCSLGCQWSMPLLCGAGMDQVFAGAVRCNERGDGRQGP